MTDVHAAIGRVQLAKLDGWTGTRQAQRARSWTRTCEGVVVPPVAEGATHVYHQYTIRVHRRPRRLRQGAGRRARRRQRRVLPDPEPPAAVVPARASTCPRPSAPPARRSRCRCTPRCRRATSSASSRPSTPSRRRVPEMADLRAGLIGLGMMGRHHARVLRSLDGVDLVAVADPAGDPHGVAGELEVFRDVEQLIAAGIDYCMVAAPDPSSTSRSAWRSRRPACTRSSRSRWPRTPPGRPSWSRRSSRAGLVGAVGPHRALQPGAAEPAHPARAGRARRGVPGDHPPTGPVPGPDRRRRRGQGPRHARHRPHRVGHPAAVRLGLGAHRVQERARARGPRRRGRHASPTAPSPATW